MGTHRLETATVEHPVSVALPMLSSRLILPDYELYQYGLCG